MNPILLGYLWCACAASASALATFLLKISSMQGAGWSVARLSWMGGAGFSYMLGFVCYSVALQKMQISLAYPVMTAITMTLVTVVGYLVLQEPLTLSKLAGITLIACGAFLLAR